MVQRNEKPISNIAEKGRAESVKIISLLGALGSWVSVATSAFAGVQTGDTRYSVLTMVGIIIAILLSASIFFANRNKVSLAAWLSIFTTEIIFITISTIIGNLGIILSIILLFIIGILALQSLSTKMALIAIITGIIASIATLLVDLLTLNPLRIISSIWLAEVTVIVGGIIILILGIQLLRYYRFTSIRAQIITAFVIISVIPLWIVASHQLIEQTNDQTRTTITISITTIVMLIALLATAITSNLLTTPIKYLTAMSERIKRGESDVPVKLERNDEIGQLSETINATSIELRQILATIESRVTERTKDLATETENIRKRTNQLRCIIEITNTITSIQNLDELLPEISRQISIIFGFYHVGIFLTDQTGQYVILQAANSTGEIKMLEKSYRVKVGQTSIVGFVTGSGQPRIALDVGDDATFFNNPDLPDTHSEIALPLRIGEIIIGALDIQSNEIDAFHTEDIGIFSLLANQISMVIQNARLFEETRAALVEAQVFYRQSATASWREVLRQGTRGFRYLNGSIEAIKTAGEPPKKITGGSSDPELLTIPINIRGKTLGVLNIRQIGRNHSWSRSEIHVYQSIVDRISFALENARLYQDAQRRASKERVLSEIATKVSSSVNMDNILQTAVEELGHVLPGSEIVIQFEQEDETGA